MELSFLEQCMLKSLFCWKEQTSEKPIRHSQNPVGLNYWIIAYCYVSAARNQLEMVVYEFQDSLSLLLSLVSPAPAISHWVCPVLLEMCKGHEPERHFSSSSRLGAISKLQPVFAFSLFKCDLWRSWPADQQLGHPFRYLSKSRLACKCWLQIPQP